ncbi:MAG: spore coat protein U domain-containing protein [Pseudoxanthomonas sp.]|nr:spore coat protein U domain-containing protein [Pseudoxanthomonas sp.]
MRSHLLLCVPLLALAVHASAQTTQTTSDDFRVSIDITKACEIIAANDISFGEVSPSASQPTATGNVQVACSTGTDYTLGLNYGQNEESSVRHMQHTTLGATAPLIPYTLSSNSGHSVPWTNSGVGLVSGTGTGVDDAISHPVYARATLAGTEPPGTYEDLVTATLTF